MDVKILVVEDESIIAMHIQSILEDEGYSVSIVNSVESAILFIESNNTQLVLLDINLNRAKDGVSLGHYLLEKGNIPYIYLTSYADKLTLDRVNETRPYGYIIKPFKPVDLITNVSIVLNSFRFKKIDLYTDKLHPVDVIPYQLKQVINFINENIDKRIEIDELVDLTEWSRHHFIKLFTKYLEIPPYQYILQRKIDKSTALIVDTDMSINEISFELGFKSYGNFCNAFKKNMEMFPLEFRKKYKK